MKTRTFEVGNHTIVVPSREVLESIYRRKNLCLKIFKTPYPPSTSINTVRWDEKGESFRENILECSAIQNLLAFKGYSPRIYDLVFLTSPNIKYVAQVTDYIESETTYEEREEVFKKNNKKIIDYCENVGISFHDIGDGRNMRNGLFVDTQEFEFTDNYFASMYKRISEGLAYAGSTDIPYQSIEELNIKGERSNKEREKLLQIPKGLPKDFTVLDFGCNGAYFMRRAFDAGAAYGVGVDVPRVNEAARELNNFLGYFNMDFMEKVPDQEFDLVLLLSAFGYAKVDEIFPKAKVALIEGHTLNGQHTEEYYRNILSKYYTKVETLGWTQDDKELPPRVVMKGTR